MKTKEEIQVLAEIAFKDELTTSNQNINWIGYGKSIDGISKEKWIELWIKGYTESEQRNQLENLFGRPLNEVYDIEKYKNPIDAINDIGSGKLKPRTNLIKYTEEDLRKVYWAGLDNISSNGCSGTDRTELLEKLIKDLK